MGMGSFAGGLAKGFTSTYGLVSDIEDRKAERERRKKEQEKEDALDKAYAETYGRVGQKDDYAVSIQEASGNKGLNLGAAQQLAAQGALPGNAPEDIDFERASAEAAAGPMRDLAARKGAIPASEAALPEMQGTEYTSRQAGADYATRAAGVSRKGAIEALQIKKAYKEDERDEKFDVAVQMRDRRLGKIYAVSETNGLKGLADAAKAEGLKVEFAETSNGIGRINVLGPKGDVLETITSLPDAVSKLENLVSSRFEQDIVGLLGGPREALTYLNQRKEFQINQQRLGIEQSREQREAALQPGRIALNKAQVANLEAETEGKTLAADEKREYNEIRTRILDLLKNPSPESQQELQQLARRAGLLNPKEVLVTKTERNPETGVLESITTNVFTGEVQKSMSEGGVAPPAVLRAAESGTNPQTGKPWTANEISDFERRYPSTPWPGPRPAGASSTRTQPTSAIPTQPEPAPATPARTGRGTAIPAGDRIPEPPPKELIRGTNRRPNPAYVEWEQKFGERYRAQQR
jgi:hypothetical protein